MKKFAVKLTSLFCALSLLAACGTPAVSSSTVPSSSPSTEATVSLKDDFYEAVNASWLASAEIPSDSPFVGGFTMLTDDIDKTLMADFDKMLAGESQPQTPELSSFVEYYRLATNLEKREADGAAPLLPYLQKIESLSSLAEFEKQWAEWALSGLPSPFSFTVMADMGNASTNALYAVPATLFLPDKAYYDESNPASAVLADAYSQMLNELLVLAGKSESEAATLTEQAMAFDASLVPVMKTAQENSDYTAMYNPMPFDEFNSFSNNFDFSSAANGVLGKTPQQVIVTNPEFFKAFDTIVNEETFPQMKSWLMVTTVQMLAPYLTDEFRLANSSFGLMISGATESSAPELSAYYKATEMYSEVVGLYYGQTYFGEEAKQDVNKMVANIVDVYKERLAANTWLSDATKKEAVKKLDSMSINVGYPDSIQPIYSQMVPDSTKSLAENTMALGTTLLKSMFSNLDTPVDRTQWPLSANTVNAMYSPMNNSINFPAAILQAPFYSVEQSPAANYGGIGAVIAHEISHAFDPNGAKFDELGNLADWWTAEDYTKFEELSQAMVAEFDGLPYGEGVVNGALTVTENVSDAGGLACSLDALKKEENPDLEAFFTNWAVIWRQKNTPEYDQLVLVMDVHAPNKLRANIQLQNMDDFYTTFGITEKDGMYRAPEDRVSIW